MVNGNGFLNAVVKESIDMNASITKWIDSGAWAAKPCEFLVSWLGRDLESERNGRTSQQMACDLCDELLEAKRRNDARIFLAKQLLDEGKCEKFSVPVMNALVFEDMVDKVMAVVK